MTTSEQLRQEVLASQQARNELLKWKLIAVGTLGAIGLGLTDYSAVKSAPLVLCIIPFVCVYIDLHCTHLWLQIHAVGKYLSSEEHDTYERFAGEAERRGVFSAEKGVLYGSTALLSLGVSGYSFIASYLSLAYFFSGLAGVLLSLVTYLCIYRKNVDELDAMAATHK